MPKLTTLLVLLLSAMVLSGCATQIISERCSNVAIIQDGGRGNDIIDYDIYKDCVKMYLPPKDTTDD